MVGRKLRCTAFALIVAALAFAQAPALSPVIQTVLYSITATDLKGELSFLASDALQGRYTPSPGLEIASEYIASQFRAAGLEPGGDQDYFQTAPMIDRHMPKPTSAITIHEGSKTTVIPVQALTILDESQAAKIDGASVIVFPARDPDVLKGVDVTAKAVVVPGPPPARGAHEPTPSGGRKSRAFDKLIASSNAAVEIVVGPPRPLQPTDRLLLPNEVQEHRVPVIGVTSDYLQNWIDNPTNDSEERTISLQIGAPDDRRVVLRNVVAILRGSDAALKDTCVVLSAHYDHLGTTENTPLRPTGAHPANPSDHIYNGANDDGSGTVSVIEIAKALAKLNPHPRRSIVFVTFFGEERGELGSQYYAKHPVFPLAKTVADINLEQVGRTDASNGQHHVNDASVTGYDYSNVPKFLEDAGRETGIKVYMDKDVSDVFFTRSDNMSLAEDGVPAHSISVAFDFPDYHWLGDRWQKIDYENMARVDRMVALAVLDIANAPKSPEWNAQNPKTLPYREAQQRLRH